MSQPWPVTARCVQCLAGLQVAIGTLLTMFPLRGCERSLLTGGRIGQARAMVVLTCASALTTVLLTRAATRSGRLVGVAMLLASGIRVQVPWLARAFGFAPSP
ncbi:hypothetical protein EWI61_11520 [Methylolobus aquaticus]|nr:hypothetical protein EWI61_11520 [Methylolobus aquaticus]